MLARLRLENIGLIENLEIPFNDGFTVFTGETGAGKSIFLDSIDLLLGGTYSSNLNRFKNSLTKPSLIQGYFSMTPLVKTWLENNNFHLEELLKFFFITSLDEYPYLTKSSPTKPNDKNWNPTITNIIPR